jgi:hypothetical protein
VTERQRVPVVMCTWKRVERLPRTLQQLALQDAPVKLHIWNNNRHEAERVDAALARGAIPARSVHSSRNIGGFGRFYLARELARSHDVVLFVDDDQDFGPTMISDQLASYAAESIAGWWAFTFRPDRRSYRERDRVETPLAPADYVGTCGMVVDPAIFLDAGLFRCPRRYWFGVEDLWLSYYASHVRRWPLRRSRAELTFVSDDKDIDLTLGATKLRCFRYLLRRGWKLPSASP